MPELPDITVYLEALERRILDQRLERYRLNSPFLLRTATPSISELEGKRVRELRRLGKRIALGFDQELWLVIHLMIAGRLHWAEGPGDQRRGAALLTLGFPGGVLTLTESGTRKRASVHVVRGEAALGALAPAGLEVLRADRASFAAALRSANHTVKRALTDPRLFSGIGNVYSDEILHKARLSPVALTHRLSEEEVTRLHNATRETLEAWIARLRTEAGDEFPEHVTAFREGMKVHGRFGRPCPDCGAPVQRIRYAENETNYCAACQTGGRLLADRSLSLLLKRDWPRTWEELEELRSGVLNRGAERGE